MRPQEIRCFLEALKVERSQLRAVNLPADALTPDLFETTDVFLVGGAGDFSVLESHPFLPPFFEFLSQVCEVGHPMFASCFGFQALCVTLGGEVATDSQSAEVGTYELWLTSEGKADPLFGLLPEKFFAQMGHKDRAVTLPDQLVNLAYSKKAPVQAFKVDERPVYATQFHPELTMAQNRTRFENYIEGYSNDKVGMDVETIRNSYRESAETYLLLPEFMKRVVLKTE